MVQIWKDRLVHERTNSDFISIDVLWLYIKSWSGSGSISRIENPCFILHLKLSNWCTLFLSTSHVWYLAGWMAEEEERRRKYQILRYHLISVPYICTLLLLWSADWLIQLTSTYISRVGGRLYITHMSNQKVKKDSYL